MKLKLFVGLSIIAGIICFSMSVSAGVNVNQFKDIPNVVLLDEGVLGGGLLNEKIIKRAKEQGVATIVDLRSPQEGSGSERVLVQKYGMNYFNVPVTPYTLRKAQADVISHILSDEANKPVIIHCGSGNRVGGLWGVYSKHYRGMDVGEAFAEAVKKGLRADDLKDKVHKLLKDSDKPKTEK